MGTIAKLVLLSKDNLNSAQASDRNMGHPDVFVRYSATSNHTSVDACDPETQNDYEPHAYKDIREHVFESDNLTFGLKENNSAANNEKDEDTVLLDRVEFNTDQRVGFRTKVFGSGKVKDE